MSLATRCMSCGTVFRVVQDQLKVSQGWVRCGHCQDVFNALESLFELAEPAPSSGLSGSATSATSQSQALPPAADSQAEPFAQAPEEPVPEPVPEPTPPAKTPPPAPAAASPATPPAPLPASPPATTSASPQERPARRAPPARTPNPDLAPDFVVSSQVLALDTDLFATGPVSPHAAHGTPTPAPGRSETPQFMRLAERRARWERPGMRAALASASAGLLLLLALQASLQWRDQLYARWPSARPGLTAVCNGLGYPINSPMAIEHIVLDSSHLAQSGRPGVLLLDAELRNDAPYPIKAPAIELSLTSDSGQVVVRKVIQGSELGRPRPELEADGLWRVELALAVGDLPIAGYSIEVFYP